MDNLSPSERSKIMARVHSKNSRPEMVVRRLIHAEGYRYRLHVRDLPGCPDMVFRGRRKVIFVHGCFWHRHESCTLARMPKSRIDFWAPKFEANKKRDERNKRHLEDEGWTVMTIWECEISDTGRLKIAIRRFLDA